MSAPPNVRAFCLEILRVGDIWLSKYLLDPIPTEYRLSFTRGDNLLWPELIAMRALFRTYEAFCSQNKLGYQSSYPTFGRAVRKFIGGDDFSISMTVRELPEGPMIKPKSLVALALPDLADARNYFEKVNGRSSIIYWAPGSYDSAESYGRLAKMDFDSMLISDRKAAQIDKIVVDKDEEFLNSILGDEKPAAFQENPCHSATTRRTKTKLLKNGELVTTTTIRTVTTMTPEQKRQRRMKLDRRNAKKKQMSDLRVIAKEIELRQIERREKRKLNLLERQRQSPSS